MVRLWVNGEDYGTMSERAADAYKRCADTDEDVKIEPVPDDAPIFLYGA